jgi:hypothetical protein
VPSKYPAPDNAALSALTSVKSGGAALNDPGAGFNVQDWTLNYADGDVTISAPSAEPVVLFSLDGITEIDLAFDQSMRPFVAFMQNGVARYWWYDSQSSGPVFSDLPDGTEAPRCCLDDRRPQGVPSSDIILAYLRSGTLYFRAERDRYETEYTLASSVTGSLRRVAMNRGLRVQFELGAPLA